MLRCGPRFRVLSGDDALTLPVLAVGGCGVISTTSNVAPEGMRDLVRAFETGDLDRARVLHQRLLPLFDAVFCETNPIPVKAALLILGLIEEEIRLPLLPLGAAHRSRLQAVLKEQGLL